VISPRGDVTDVRFIGGPLTLRDAAVEAVRQWRYTPTLLDGMPVPVIMTVTVNFTIS
jgi:protein TonB